MPPVSSQTMKHVVFGILILALWAAPALADAVPTMPFSEVREGMRGTARTVFAGTTVESFDVEILGKLPNIGPRQNLILARCSGGPLAQTGILAGMSGSPVTIDGRLVGAIAYSWGFSTEAIAGITPIEEMLEVARRDSPAADRIPRTQLDTDWHELLFDAKRIQTLWDGKLSMLGAVPRGSWSQPLSLAGFGPGAGRIRERLDRAGIQTIQGAGSASSPGETAPPLEPGSAIALKLVRGDIEMAASGTVTWIDQDGVLAFGHPLFGLGAVDLPLSGARVEALLPSLQSSSRLAVPLNEIGALRQDRAAAVFGKLKAEPAMIPIRVQLDNGAESRTFSFDVADDPLLAPVLFYLSLNGIIGAAERTSGSLTMRVAEGSVIKMADDEDVALDNVFAGPQALDFATGIPAYILHLLMNNVWTAPRIVGINIILEYDLQPRSARLMRVVSDRYRVSPGESIDLDLIVAPFRGPRRTLHTSVRIPDEQPAGKLTLLVAGAATVQRNDQSDASFLPKDLNQLVRLINQLRRNDRLYIVASAADPGLFIEGSRMPNLPPSAAEVLSRPGGDGGRGRMSHRHVLEESLSVDQFIEGAARVELEILPR
jgi:hypothetical protein